MVTRASARAPSGAAERRLRALAPNAGSVREAARQVILDLLQDVTCPPTDLDAVGRKIDVQEIAYESFAGSRELHKRKNGYRIVCSSDQPRASAIYGGARTCIRDPRAHRQERAARGQ